jgi:hypothetical protein
MKIKDQTASFYDLRDALPQPGCAVCRLKTSSVDQFLDSLLWESVNDPDKRQEIRQAQGFCHAHAWRLAYPGALLGVAIIMRDVLQNALRAIENAPFQALPPWSPRRMYEALNPKQQAAATAALASRLEPQAACPACVWAEKMEGIYLDVFISNLLGEEGLLAAYRSSDGLCLPHFRQVLSRVREERAFEALIDAQRAIWERLVGDLSEFIRKSDYRFRHESWGEERDAWLRAIAALTGLRLERDERSR